MGTKSARIGGRPFGSGSGKSNRFEIERRRKVVLRMWETGKTDQEIAAKTGVCDRTILRDRKAMGIPTKVDGEFFRKFNRERSKKREPEVRKRRSKVAELRAKGFGYVKIGKILGIGSITVRKDVLAMGLPTFPVGVRLWKREKRKN